MSRFRRLATRYERRTDIHHAFTALACSLICLNALQGRFRKALLVGRCATLAAPLHAGLGSGAALHNAV
jgi:hypothetical protein